MSAVGHSRRLGHVRFMSAFRLIAHGWQRRCSESNASQYPRRCRIIEQINIADVTGEASVSFVTCRLFYIVRGGFRPNIESY